MNRTIIFLMLILSACNNSQEENNLIIQEDVEIRLTKDEKIELKNNEDKLYSFINRLKDGSTLTLQKWWLSPDVLTPSDVNMDSMEYYGDGYKKFEDKTTILAILDYFLKNYQNSKIISLDNSIENLKISRAFFKFSSGENHLIINIPNSYNEKSKPVIFQITIQYSNGKVISFPKKLINPHFLIERGI